MATGSGGRVGGGVCSRKTEGDPIKQVMCQDDPSDIVLSYLRHFVVFCLFFYVA